MKIKKIVAGAMCIGIVSSGFVFGTANAASLHGDVNADSKVDSKDAVLILKEYATNLTKGSTGINKNAADVNSDGSVDSKDAVWVLKYYASTLTGYKSSLDEFVNGPILESGSSVSIKPIVEKGISINKMDIKKFSDKITTKNEKKTYRFKTGEEGTYRFYLSNVPQNISFDFYLYNSSMEQLKYGYGDNGDGITAYLNANTEYYFVVKQSYNTGSYTLNIGSQKPTTNISAYTSVDDSTQFKSQRNIYKFTSSVAGRYRFDLSNVPQNISFNFYLYNSSMEQLSHSYGDNGDGITAELDANTEYYFVVEQSYNTGSYTLNIGSQKPTTDISAYTIVNDSTQFRSQRNIYEFTPSETRKYRFELSNVSKNTSFSFYLYNSSMEQLNKSYGNNGDGITAELDANKKYYFVVEQSYNTGSYTLNIG